MGVGTTRGPAEVFSRAVVPVDGTPQLLADQAFQGSYRHDGDDSSDDKAEWVVPVQWSKTLDPSRAVDEKGLFGNQNSACKLRQKFTLDRLYTAFELDQ